MTQECNQDKRQTNSTPDSSSGIVSDYHGVTNSEISEGPKPTRNSPGWQNRLRPITTPSPTNTQSKRFLKKTTDTFSPEKHAPQENEIYQNICEINKILEPIEEKLSHLTTKQEAGEIKKGGRLKKQVSSLFQPSPTHTLTKPHKSKPHSKCTSTNSSTNDTLKNFSFDSLTDGVTTHIFSYLLSNQLCKCAMVNKRWYQLVWNPRLWASIQINSYRVDADAAMRSLTRALSIDDSRVCLIVQSIELSNCRRLTDRGIFTIAKRCPELKELVLDACPEVTNIAIFEVVSRCTNLELLSVAGCQYVTCISLTPEANLQASAYGKQVYLHHLDMSDCCNVDDSSLQIIATYLSNLMHLYLRRCLKISDIGVQYVATYCPKLQELSVSDCPKISDLGLRDISRLGNNLKYLSIAKCRKVSDAGIKCLTSNCTKIRYLNIRGCEKISEEGLIFLSSMCSKLKSIDVGSCHSAVTDNSLVALARNCRHLKRLSIRECRKVTDGGLKDFSIEVRHLQQINIIDCSLTSSSFKALSQHCNDCIIEYNDSGFCNSLIKSFHCI